MVGVFPPPIHGQSLSNEALRKHLAAAGDQPSVINLSPDTASRSYRARLGRSLVVLRGLARFVFLLVTAKRGGSVVISMSGGYGIAYDLVFAGLSRLSGRRLFLHHHNYTYVDKPRLLMKWITLVSGSKATHIVLCERMGVSLKSRYPRIVKTTWLSNVVFLDDSGVPRAVKPRGRLEVIGYISNITVEKGIYEFLDTLEELGRRGVRVSARIAGPIEDDALKSELLSRLERLGSIQYVGAVYGSVKEEFYRGIDLFLFPSRNEAEGRVIHEAMYAGVPVIAADRGCVRDVIGSRAGWVVEGGESFVERAVERIETWVLFPAQFETISRAAIRRFHEVRRESQVQLNAICRLILTGR